MNWIYEVGQRSSKLGALSKEDSIQERDFPDLVLPKIENDPCAFCYEESEIIEQKILISLWVQK